MAIERRARKGPTTTRKLNPFDCFQWNRSFSVADRFSVIGNRRSSRREYARTTRTSSCDRYTVSPKTVPPTRKPFSFPIRVHATEYAAAACERVIGEYLFAFFRIEALKKLKYRKKPRETIVRPPLARAARVKYRRCIFTNTPVHDDRSQTIADVLLARIRFAHVSKQSRAWRKNVSVSAGQDDGRCRRVHGGDGAFPIWTRREMAPGFRFTPTQNNTSRVDRR